jgi:acyclic terpene utilization AtuA family protein
MTKPRVVIANCGGFWGDDPGAARRQVEGGPIDYLTMDYLAEVTMAILQKQRARKPDAGYPADFLLHLRDVLPACVQRGIRIITNAGGVNPLACRAAVVALARELGVADRVKVALVLGDDLYADLDAVLASGEPLINMDTGKPLADIRNRVLSANTYIGAAPIVRALQEGANVIVTGRVADAAVTLAPMMFEFGWTGTDWDRIAAGVVAGHIIECGAQCTGGNFTDWHQVKSFRNMGFPLVEAEPDGSFVVTKHPNTGGLVTVHTVSEQILYEIGAPGYLTPDVVARFDSVRLEQQGADRVRVTGARGEPAPPRLKVSVSYHAGWRAFGRLILSGPDTLAKAKVVADAFWDAAGGRGAYEQAVHQFIGWNACHPPMAKSEPGEVLLQFAVRDQDARKINTRFASQLVPRVLGTVPGISYIADQGRPRASEVVAFWPALISRAAVTPRVIIGDRQIEIPDLPAKEERVSSEQAGAKGQAVTATRENYPASLDDSTLKRSRVPLSRLCLARSGDKGDTANIGVIARSEAIYDWMLEHLTPSFVKRHFEDVCKGEVERFELANLLAVNFLLHQSLGGGGTLSLLLDAQGKTYAQYLLAAEVEVPEGLLNADSRVARRQEQHHV